MIILCTSGALGPVECLLSLHAGQTARSIRTRWFYQMKKDTLAALKKRISRISQIDRLRMLGQLLCEVFLESLSIVLLLAFAIERPYTSHPWGPLNICPEISGDVASHFRYCEICCLSLLLKPRIVVR